MRRAVASLSAAPAARASSFTGIKRCSSLITNEFSTLSAFPASDASSAAGKRGTKGHSWFYDHLQGVADARARDSLERLAPLPPSADHERMRIFMKFTQRGQQLGERVVFELASDYLPKTAENLRRLVSRRADKELFSNRQFSLKDTIVHSVIQDVAFLGGDVYGTNGRAGHSGFPSEPTISEEGHVMRHDRKGLLSMVSSKKDSVNSVFFVTLSDDPSRLTHLDGYNVPIGFLTEGETTLDLINDAFCVNREPLDQITLSECGVLEPSPKASSEEVEAYETAKARAAIAASEGAEAVWTPRRKR